MRIMLVYARFSDTDLEYMGLFYDPPAPLFPVHLDLLIAHMYASTLILQPMSIMWDWIATSVLGWVSRIVYILSARGIKPSDSPRIRMVSATDLQHVSQSCLCGIPSLGGPRSARGHGNH
jgi:hypothetical protein